MGHAPAVLRYQRQPRDARDAAGALGEAEVELHPKRAARADGIGELAKRRGVQQFNLGQIDNESIMSGLHGAFDRSPQASIEGPGRCA